MLQLQLGPDHEPHCSRPGCDERIGTIKVVVSGESDEFPTFGEWYEYVRDPSWTESDEHQGHDDSVRRFVLGSGWHLADGVWRKGTHKRGWRPHLTTEDPIENVSPKVDPLHSPALPATVECRAAGPDRPPPPRC